MTVRSDHGMRTRAGQLLSAYLREISNEETEMVRVDGVDTMVTKAEALARNIWRDALGYTEMKKDKDGNLIELVHVPIRAAQCIVFDRIEGRAPASMSEGADKLTAAERVSEQSVKRIAKAGKINEE